MRKLDELARELGEAAIAFEQHRSMKLQGRVYFDFDEVASAALLAYGEAVRERAAGAAEAEYEYSGCDPSDAIRSLNLEEI